MTRENRIVQESRSRQEVFISPDERKRYKGLAHTSGLDVFLHELNSKPVADILAQEKNYYPFQKRIVCIGKNEQAVAKYITSQHFGETIDGKRKPVTCILPGIWESVYSHTPTIKALEGQQDVLILDYANYASPKDFIHGTKDLLQQLGIEHVNFYGVSLGGLVMQKLIKDIRQHTSTQLSIDSAIALHTAGLDSHLLNQILFRILRILPKEVELQALRATKFAARRRLQNSQVDSVPDDLALSRYFTYATDTYVLNEVTKKGDKNRAFRYHDFFHQVTQREKTSNGHFDEIPLLDIYTPGDPVMFRKGRELHKEAELYPLLVHPALAKNSHENARYSTEEVSGKIKVFLNRYSK